MFSKKRIIITTIVCVLFILVYVFTPIIENYFKWKQYAKAAGALPYQIGLTNVVIIKCFTTGSPPVCAGGTLCIMKDAASCTFYSDVSGTPAGGMGSNGLFLNTAISTAGLTPGGQLIAGGTSPPLMDNGVLASSGGCSGCYAKSDTIDKIKNWFDYIIAGFK